MSRIKATFQELAAKGERALIPYLTAGDPDLEATEDLIVEMAARGANIIELGVPFSDPMADGPVIQRAVERSLARGTTLRKILEMATRLRKKTDVPVVLFSYFNPVYQFGLEKLAKVANEAGIDGLLITDLVAEEAGSVIEITRANDMDAIFLIAPTSSDERIAKIAKVASGFIYAVSRTGITGVRQSVSDAIVPLINRIKRVTDLPVAAGFGISKAEHVQEVWKHTEAAVVGSRIVAEIANCSDREKLVSHIGNLISELRGERSS